MNLIAILEALVETGTTPEQMLAVARRHEAQSEAKAAERRTKDAARKKAFRVRNRPAESAGHPETPQESAKPSPHVGAGTRVVTPFSSSLRSEEVVVGVVSAREPDPKPDDWPDGNASRHADMLVETVASPWLDPCKSPDLVTTRGRVAAWKRDGASWEHDVLPVVTGLCANRRSKVGTWKFFDEAIARSISENRRALEIPEAGTVVPIRSTGPPGNSITDRIAAEQAEARRRVLEG